MRWGYKARLFGASETEGRATAALWPGAGIDIDIDIDIVKTYID